VGASQFDSALSIQKDVRWVHSTVRYPLIVEMSEGIADRCGDLHRPFRWQGAFSTKEFG